MPAGTAHSPLASELMLPPPFSVVRLREVGDAFAHAASIAAERGAGTLVYVGRFDLAEFAVVLEPDEPLAKARRAFYAGMTALAHALIAIKVWLAGAGWHGLTGLRKIKHRHGWCLAG